MRRPLPAEGFRPRFRWLLPLCLGILAPLGLPDGAAARHGAPPRSFSVDPAGGPAPLGLAPERSVDLVVLPEVDPDAFLREDEAMAAAGEPVPLRFAAPVPVRLSSSADGTWERLPDGGSLWRLRVVSPGALSLHFGLGTFRLPPGGTFHVYPAGAERAAGGLPEQAVYEGPYEAADASPEGELWTPVVPGDDVVLELYVPAGASTPAEVEIVRVGHDYRGFARFLREAGGKSGDCNIDVICSDGDNWRKEIRSVAVYQLGGPGGSFVCTGTLLNSLDPARPPLFLTANHCDIDLNNDQTMVVYWKYEAPGCGVTGDNGDLSLNQIGAQLLANWASSDFALVRLSQTPAANFEPYYSGWDAREASRPASGVAIHHPNCDEKAISFNDNALRVTGYMQTPEPGDGTHWRIDQWERGTTEPGSSGSGLWDPDHRLVGQLHGGYASCSSITSDWYGRLSRSWSGGGAPASRLSDWLDPTGTGTLLVDGYDPQGVPVVAGDANVDGSVNALDLVAVVNDILEIQVLSGQGRENADRNDDGVISVLDLVRVVNLILDPGFRGAAPVAAGASAEPLPALELAARLEGGEGGTALLLEGDPGTAAAFVVTLRAGAKAERSTALAASVEAGAGWFGAASQLADGRIRLLFYRMGGPGTQGADGALRARILLPAEVSRLELVEGMAAGAAGEARALRLAGLPAEPEDRPIATGEPFRVGPNPARNSLELRFTLQRSEAVTAQLFDAAGRMVAERADLAGSAGLNTLTWAFARDAAAPVRPGMYFVRVSQGGIPVGEGKVAVAP